MTCLCVPSIVAIDGHKCGETTRILSGGPAGHIAVMDAEKGFLGGFSDMGPVLQMWCQRSSYLNPEKARELAAALIAWADRTRGPVKDQDTAEVETIVESIALFEVDHG